jgi:alpha-D-xyloside xylohydrolase
VSTAAQPGSGAGRSRRLALAGLLAAAAAIARAANPPLPLLNEAVDVSGDFRDFSNFYFLADRLAAFDPATHAGAIAWQRNQYRVQHAFLRCD